MTEQNTPTTNVVEEGKTMAIISYLTIIGTIIAYVMNKDKKNTFASFHIRQHIGITLLYLVNAFVIGKFSGTASWIVSIFILVLWFIGFIGAVQGQEKRVPLLGDMFQDWFKGI
jgi:uncharacterized membrane protein